MCLSDVRVGGCAYHVPGMGAWRCAHVPGMGAFERHTRGRVCLPSARDGCISATCAWAGVLTMRQAWVHLRDMRVGGCAYQWLPCAWAGVLTMWQAWVHLSDMRVGGCAYHVAGMGAFERHARGWVCLPCARHGCQARGLVCLPCAS